jgi:periplasmic mercuric ion binding protein
MKVTMLTVLNALIWTVPVAAAETIELKSVHMCCEGCADEVASILDKVKGVTGVVCDQKAGKAKFKAADGTSAQKALDALAEGGFHGDTGNQKLSFKNDSGAKAGKVKSLTVTGFHNSCPGCVKSFRTAIKDVPGVTGAVLKSKVSSAEVTGEFDPVELVKALNKAGFHVKVKQ